MVDRLMQLLVGVWRGFDGAKDLLGLVVCLLCDLWRGLMALKVMLAMVV